VPGSLRELERLLAAFLRDEVELAAKLEAVRKGIPQLRQMIAEAKAAELSTSTNASSSMFGSKMEIQNERANKRVKISASMTSDSAPKRAMLEAGITSRDVAKLLHVGHSTVNAWCTGARSIPRHHAIQIRNKHRIPVAVWPKLAD
jgi:DNA-binding transcriptional regulator YiaG